LEGFALISFETFIVVVALIAAGFGTLVLLSSLAGKRARLIKAFNMQQEAEARERQIASHHQNKNSHTASSPLPAN
jgi:hypothetical protein